VHYVVLLHKEESDQNLNGKAFYQVEGKALKVVHLNELVKVDA
jgi:hypothetical protein